VITGAVIDWNREIRREDADVVRVECGHHPSS
jgi:hypothetical protein